MSIYNSPHVMLKTKIRDLVNLNKSHIFALVRTSRSLSPEEIFSFRNYIQL